MSIKPSNEQKEIYEKQLVREYFDNKTKGFFVDVGANDPTTIKSQSNHLEKMLNWSGILVEPNPAFTNLAIENRPRSILFEGACIDNDNKPTITLYIPLINGQEIDVHAGIGKNIDGFDYSNHKEIEVKARTLNSILEERNVSEIDLLSIDVEGAELQVLKGFDIHKYRPKLILLEDKHLYLNKHRYLKRHGYHLIKRTGINFWYAPEGSKKMQQSLYQKFRIMKRMYISIWPKKISYCIRHKTLRPLTSI